MENNQAFVCTLKNIRKIEGADKIVQADVTLNSIVIASIVTGVDTKENTSVVYFDSNLCLSDKMIEEYPELKTYLGKGNRVKVVKLRGCTSNGLAVDVSKFKTFCIQDEDQYPKDFLLEGYAFTEIDGTGICQKYTPVIKVSGICSNSKKGKTEKKVSRMIPEQFHFHVNTEMLVRNAHKINPDQIISISQKIHGTSAICGNVLVKRKFTLKDKITKLFKVNVTDTEYDYVYASRTVIKNGLAEKNLTGYYKEDLWTLCGEKYFKGKLHKGETIYYEIVGYLPSGGFIQKGFDYGCKPTEHRIAVYRITKTGIDGDVVEYSWQSMKDRCMELNVPAVKELYFGKARDLYPDLDTETHWNQNFIERLKKDYLEKDLVDNISCKAPDEGIVLRVESKNINVFKLKSERFYLKESESHEKGDIDMEEQGDIIP